MNNFTVDELAKAISVALDVQKTTTVVDSKDAGWAVKSKFYNQTLADGDVYNPYLVRRWLPSQYQRMIRTSSDSDMSMSAVIKNGCDYMYEIEWLKTEVSKVAYLESRDKVSFKERSNFVKPDVIRGIIGEYTRQVKEVIENTRTFKRYNGNQKCINLSGYGVVVKEIKNINGKYETTNEYKRLLSRYDLLMDDINSCWYGSGYYERINNILNGVKFVKVKHGKHTATFVDAFQKAGAYYTLKNLILFGNVKYSDDEGMATDVVDSKRRLAKALKDGYPGYVFHAILMKSINDSNYSIR